MDKQVADALIYFVVNFLMFQIFFLVLAYEYISYAEARIERKKK